MPDHTQTLAAVIDLIRRGDAVTRPELVRRSDLGRSVVNQRVEQALAAGILVERDEGLSTGGRPSKILTMSPTGPCVLSAVFGVSRLHVALADLAGRIIADSYFHWDIGRGPEASIQRLDETVRELLDANPDRELWAGAVGLPGPIEFGSGRPVAPPIMPGWDDHPVRDVVERRLQVPVWLDNDVNLMALGAWHETRLAAGDNLLLIKVGTGIGAGLVSRGRLHRGARGAAGDLGHVAITDRSPIQCRCGNFGCLEAYAGGWAMARDAFEAGRAGESEYLAEVLHTRRAVTVEDVVSGALDGDEVSRDLVSRCGVLIGKQLAAMVSFFNPSTVFIGGSVVRTGGLLLDEIRNEVMRRALRLTTSDLVIREVPLQHYEGVIGGAHLALDQIFAPDTLSAWLSERTPRALYGTRTEFVEAVTLADRLNLLSEVEAASNATLPSLPLTTTGR